jgi:hypothetical protein
MLLYNYINAARPRRGQARAPERPARRVRDQVERLAWLGPGAAVERGAQQCPGRRVAPRAAGRLYEGSVIKPCPCSFIWRHRIIWNEHGSAE